LIRDDIAFFDSVRNLISQLENTPRQLRDDEQVETAVRQIISGHLSGDGVEDVFALAGLDKPDISVIDDDFKAKFASSDNQHLQLEAARRLIANEVRIVEGSNVAAGRKFSAMLAEAMNRYRNRTIDSADVIAEMVELAKQMRALRERGHDLGLSEAEVAFYDALADNASAREVLQDATMVQIAQDLTAIVRNDTKTDWQFKETVRAKIRTRIKRLLLRYGYPRTRLRP